MLALERMSVDNIGQLPAYLIPDANGLQFSPKDHHHHHHHPYQMASTPVKLPSNVGPQVGSNSHNASPITVSNMSGSASAGAKRKRSDSEQVALPSNQSSTAPASTQKTSNKRAKDEDSAPTPQYDQPKKKSKLGYHRTSVACAHCRRRKIRCIIPENNENNICTNCSRLKKDCYFYPAEQGSMPRTKASTTSAARPQQPFPPQSPYPGNYDISFDNNFSHLPSNSFGGGNQSSLATMTEPMTANTASMMPNVASSWHTPSPQNPPSFPASDLGRDPLFPHGSSYDAFSPSTVSGMTQPPTRSPSFNPIGDGLDLGHHSSTGHPAITSHPRQDGYMPYQDVNPNSTVPRSLSYQGPHPYAVKPNTEPRGRSATLPHFGYDLNTSGNSPGSLTDAYNEQSQPVSAMSVPMGQPNWSAPYYMPSAAPQQHSSPTGTPGMMGNDHNRRPAKPARQLSQSSKQQQQQQQQQQQEAQQHTTAVSPVSNSPQQTHTPIQPQHITYTTHGSNYSSPQMLRRVTTGHMGPPSGRVTTYGTSPSTPTSAITNTNQGAHPSPIEGAQTGNSNFTFNEPNWY